MIINVISTLTKFFSNIRLISSINKAINKQKINIFLWNPRNYSKKHKINDKPYGGGAGTILCYWPIKNTIEYIITNNTIKSTKKIKLIYFTPQGTLLNQNYIEKLSKKEYFLILISGRYRGIDERLIIEYDMEEVSIGDYILSSGDIPIITFIDSLCRCFNGVLNNNMSYYEDSFPKNLLDSPHYTRPKKIGNTLDIPNILLSGNHEKIKLWRKKVAMEKTKIKRPDILKKYLKGKKHE